MANGVEKGRRSSPRGRGLGGLTVYPRARDREDPGVEVAQWFVPAVSSSLHSPVYPAAGPGTSSPPSLFFAIPHNNNYHCRVLLAPGLAFYMYFSQ